MVKPAFDLQRLRGLPVAERLELISVLWDSVAQDAPDAAFPVSPELSAELDRRLAEHDANPESALEWEQVRAEILRGTFRRES